MDPTAAAFEAAIVSLSSDDPHQDLLRQVEATRAQMETKLLQLYFAAERERLALSLAGLTDLADLVGQVETAQAAYDHAIDVLAAGFPLPPPDEAVCSRCSAKFTRGFKGAALNLCEACARHFDEEPAIAQEPAANLVCKHCGKTFPDPGYPCAFYCSACLALVPDEEEVA